MNGAAGKASGASAGRRAPAPRGRAARSAGAAALLLPLFLLVMLATGCSPNPGCSSPHRAARHRPQVRRVPGRLRIPTAYIANLTAPTAFDFDADKNLIVAQGGIAATTTPASSASAPTAPSSNLPPLRPGSPCPSAPAASISAAPSAGSLCHNGKLYVSHRDRNGFGVITAFDYYGRPPHRRLRPARPGRVRRHRAWPSDPRTGRLYFGVGTATNSGVVGLDDCAIGWVGHHPDVCDARPDKTVKLPAGGSTRPTPSPSGSAANWPSPAFPAVQHQQPDHHPRLDRRPPGPKPNGGIFSVPADGGEPVSRGHRHPQPARPGVQPVRHSTSPTTAWSSAAPARS